MTPSQKQRIEEAAKDSDLVYGEYSAFIAGAKLMDSLSTENEAEKWISVNDEMPDLGEDGESELVLVAGFKMSRPESIRYDLVHWERLIKPDLTDSKGNPILYGWSKRWWDTNPDYYQIHWWRKLQNPEPINWSNPYPSTP